MDNTKRIFQNGSTEYKAPTQERGPRMIPAGYPLQEPSRKARKLKYASVLVPSKKVEDVSFFDRRENESSNTPGGIHGDTYDAPFNDGLSVFGDDIDSESDCASVTSDGLFMRVGTSVAIGTNSRLAGKIQKRLINAKQKSAITVPEESNSKNYNKQDNDFHDENNLVLENSVCARASESTSLECKRTASKILVGGQNVMPPNTMDRLQLHELLERRVSKYMKSERMDELCKYSWPSLLRKRSVVLVAPPDSWINETALLPMINQQLSAAVKRRYTTSPGIIVLCDSLQTVDNVYNACDRLLGMCDRILAVHRLGYGGDELTCNGAKKCDIIISTVVPLLNALRYGQVQIGNSWTREGRKNTLCSLSQTTQLLLTDATKLLTRQWKEVISVLDHWTLDVQKKASNLNHRQQSCGWQSLAQVVACTNRWSAPLEEFVRGHMREPIIMFDSPTEAAACARVNVSAHAVNENRLHDVAEFTAQIAPDYTMCGWIIIVADCSQNVKLLESLLKKQSLPSRCKILAATQEDKLRKATALPEYIQKETRTSLGCGIFILTDTILDALNIRSAKVVIHVFAPQVLKLQDFHNRMLAMSDSFVFNFFDVDGKKTDCSCHIFLDRNDRLPQMMRYLRHVSATVDPKIIEWTCLQLEDRDKNKLNPLCPNLKERGFCSGSDVVNGSFEFHCACRHHLLLDADQPLVTNIENTQVAFRVVKVDSPSRIWAQIETVKGCNTFPDYSKTNIMRDIQGYMSKPENCVPLHDVEMGKLCTVLVSEDFWQRGQILKINAAGTNITVLLIDTGTTVIKNISELYEMSEDLKKIPPAVIEVICDGFVPGQGEPDWSKKATFEVQNMFNSESNDTPWKLTGEVYLMLHNTVWLKRAQSYRKVNGKFDRNPPLRRSLCDRDLAVEQAENESPSFIFSEEFKRLKMPKPQSQQLQDVQSSIREITSSLCSSPSTASESHVHNTQFSVSDSAEMQNNPCGNPSAKKGLHPKSVNDIQTEKQELIFHKRTDIPECDLPDGNSVILTYVDARGSCVVYNADHYTSFNKFQKDLSLWYKGSATARYTLDDLERDCVAAVYDPKESVWKRAVFPPSKNGLHAYFLDYGVSVECMEEAKIEILPDFAVSVPPYAVPCCLAGVMFDTALSLEACTKACFKTYMCEILHDEEDDTGILLCYVNLYTLDTNKELGAILQGRQEENDVTDTVDETTESRAVNSSKETCPLVQKCVSQEPQTCIPRTYWWQDAHKIHMRVDIVDPSDISVHVNRNHLLLKAEANGKTYVIDTELFTRGENVTITSKGVNVSLSFDKLVTEFKWPRLLSTAVKQSWVIPDIDHADVPDDDEQKTDVSPLWAEEQHTSDDESYDEDDSGWCDA